jgi:hypothetical protein
LVEGAADFFGIGMSVQEGGMGENVQVGGVFIQFTSHSATAPPWHSNIVVAWMGN